MASDDVTLGLKWWGALVGIGSSDFCQPHTRVFFYFTASHQRLRYLLGEGVEMSSRSPSKIRESDQLTPTSASEPIRLPPFFRLWKHSLDMCYLALIKHYVQLSKTVFKFA